MVRDTTAEYPDYLFESKVVQITLAMMSLLNINKLFNTFYCIKSHLIVKVEGDNAVQGGHGHQHDLRF